MTQVLTGYIRQGKMVWSDPQAAQELVKSLEGCRVEVIIRKAFRKASASQHRYYRGVVLPVIGEHIGCAPAEAHRALKRELLPVNPEALNPKVRSTAHLSKQEFGEYLNQICVLASEIGIVIPAPNEVEP